MKRIIACSFLALLGGCARAPQSVFAPPPAPSEVRTTAPAGTGPPAPPDDTIGPLAVALLSPHAEDRVSQFGSSVRFQIHGALPEGSRPMVFVRDATGLNASNWWSMPEPTRNGSGWECPVQFGEPRDSDSRFAIAVFVLRDENRPAIGLTGTLPTTGLASSEVVEVIRQ